MRTFPLELGIRGTRVSEKEERMLKIGARESRKNKGTKKGVEFLPKTSWYKYCIFMGLYAHN